MTEGADTAEFVGNVEPPTPPLDFNQLIADLAQRTEAGEAILTGSGVEDWLKYLIELQMRHDLSKTKKEDLFSGYGPLASFSAKIAIAFALKLIDEQTEKDLTLIRKIRNEFAHPKNGYIHFASDEINKLCLRFSGDNSSMANKLLYGNRALACVEKIKAACENGELIRAIKKASKQPSPGKEK